MVRAGRATTSRTAGDRHLIIPVSSGHGRQARLDIGVELIDDCSPPTARFAARTFVSLRFGEVPVRT